MPFVGLDSGLGQLSILRPRLNKPFMASGLIVEGGLRGARIQSDLCAELG